MGRDHEDSGQLHVLSLLENLRSECKDLWSTSSKLYFHIDELLRELANPNLHDIPTQLPFRVELWDRDKQSLRWVMAAAATVDIGHAALDVAIATHPRENLTLRNRRWSFASTRRRMPRKLVNPQEIHRYGSCAVVFVWRQTIPKSKSV